MLQAIKGTASESWPYASKAFQWAGAAILDACTMESANGHLLVLTADGSLHVLDLDHLASTHLCTVALPAITHVDGGTYFGVPSYRLHASPDGAFVAVVVDRGRAGIVVDTQAGTTTLQLDGGDYYEETVPFSACFLRLDGRDVFVHRTAWNRLDACDPATGKSLTDRHIAPYESAGARPEHYLDYFHGQVLPSPEGKLIFDDGWVWHPISVPRVWSVETWLRCNPWESEDGASIVDLGLRDDWSQPACWIDEHRVAIWGASDWDDEACEEVKQGPGVRIIEVTEGKLVTDSWWPLVGMENPTTLFSDGVRLYVATTEGTTAWDIDSRQQLADHPGLVAQLFDQTRNTLLAFKGEEIREVALPR